MREFKIRSKFEPAGDQGQAIDGLVEGFNNNLNPQRYMNTPDNMQKKIFRNIDKPQLTDKPQKVL